MEKENKICFYIEGKRALFSDPITRVGGEKFSYTIPTYQALKGIAESIYWKPSFVWKILRVRIINKIQTENIGIRPIKYNDQSKNDLSLYTYLKDVAYEVEAKFEWNENRPDLKNDWNENKHYFIAKRSLEKGGRRDIFLGTRECQAYVMPCEFGEHKSFYENSEEFTFGLHFHSFIYPDEAFDNDTYEKLTATFWYPKMEKGVVNFTLPNKTDLRKEIYKSKKKDFIIGENYKIEEVD